MGVRLRAQGFDLRPRHIARIDRRSVELSPTDMCRTVAVFSPVSERSRRDRFCESAAGPRATRCDGYELFEELALERGGAQKRPGQGLRDAVARHGDVARRCRRRAVSDVPLGCFLSGGIELVACCQPDAVATEQAHQTSIGFDVDRFNEAPHTAVWRHLGTEHTEFPVSEDDALSLVRNWPRSTMNRSETLRGFRRRCFAAGPARGDGC